MIEAQLARAKRLQMEKVHIQTDLSREGFQLIMKKLRKAAESAREEYDNCNFATEAGIAKAMKIQATREVILDHIPALLEGMMNADQQPEEEPWSFIQWLKGIL